MGLRKLRVVLPLVSLLLLWQIGYADNEEVEGSFAEGATCGTQRIWMEKMGKPLSEIQACSNAGMCDVPSNRDAWIPDSAFPITYVRMVVHILRNDNGTNPISTDVNTQTIIDNLNADYLPSKIQFEVLVDYVNSTAWRTLSEGEIFAMKEATAYKPDSFLNVWATTVDFGYSYGTFPWDPEALGNQSGIVMGHFHWTTSSHVFAHEVGHCLGLYHTFNGVDEVTQCGACYEAVNSPDRDVRGDRCSDTPPAPTISTCSASGTDPCSGQSWGAAFNNLHSYMSYSNCIEFFTTQQMGRMQCWTNDALSGLVSNVRIQADKQVGAVPLEVTFDGITAKSVNTWDWDFGDGGNGAVQQPMHTYTTPGLYDVSVTIQTDQGDFTTTREPFIAAHADTIVSVDTEAGPGDSVFVTFSVTNYVPLTALKIPFTWAGPLDLAIVDLRTTGLRSEVMGTKQLTSFVPSSEQAAYFLSQGAGSVLAPGSGPVLTVVFIMPENASGGPNPITIESYSGQDLRFDTEVGYFEPTAVSGDVALSIGVCGDANNDGIGPNVVDLNYLVAYFFLGGAAPTNPSLCDVNSSGGLDVVDLNYLVAFLFLGGNAPNCL